MNTSLQHSAKNGFGVISGVLINAFGSLYLLDKIRVPIFPAKQPELMTAFNTTNLNILFLR